MQIKNNQRTVLHFSIMLFIGSLMSDAYCVNDNCNDSASGFMCFITGWIGVLMGGAAISWLANPTLLLSWLFFKNKKTLSTIFSIISTMFCLSFLMFDEIIVNEAGHYGQITDYKMGYWFWLLSSASIFLGNIWILYMNKLEKPTANTVYKT